MKRLLLTLGIMALICNAASAARNAGGAILAHTNDEYTYSLGTRCDNAFVQNIDSCDDIITRTDRTENAVIWHVAGFPDGSSPGVQVVYHGIEIDAQCVGPDVWAFCGPAGSLEIPDANWPQGDPEGDDISVAFGSPIYDQWFAFYVLRVTDFCGAGNPFWCTSINHVGGYASFVDDSNPPLEDRIDKFGCVVWYGEGNKECPEGVPQEGACCFGDGSCQILGADACAQAGGVYQGDGTVCDPNPCPRPEACCFEDQHCEMLLADACTAAGGTPQGPGTVCDPNPCIVQPEWACCVGEECSIQTLENCTAMGGQWLEGQICDPNPCLQPDTAACCVGEECRVTTEEDCMTAGGTWYPEQETCEGFTCPPVATEETTWGRIKANYR